MIPAIPRRAPTWLSALLALLSLAFPATADARGVEGGPEAPVPPPQGEAGLPPYLADRGRGIATSQFGTYVRKGEWLVYTFYEYTKTSGFEYSPEELGFTGSQEHFGTLKEKEGLLFVSYGISDRLAVELEGALHATSSLRKAPDDFSAVPNRLEESGLGDVEGQVRWRWAEEGEHRPEMLSFFEVVFPLQRDNVLLGTQGWEYALGFAAIKGHPWGTLTGRVSISHSEGQIEVGEYAVEYLKRLSPAWRFYAAIEGEQTDEVALIVEGQARLGRHVLLKLNSGFGVTKKAPDVAPEIGLLFSF
jgi:hypothetical protein